MLELMIVIGIIAIISAVAVPALFNWLPGYRVRAAVRDLKSDMVLARLRAVRENANVAMVFNTGGNSYTIFVDNGAGGGVAGNWVQDGGEVLVKPQVVVPNGVAMYEASYAFGNPRCSFNGRGLPNGGGHVYMSSTGNDFWGIVLSLVGNVQTVTSNDGGGSWADVH